MEDFHRAVPDLVPEAAYDQDCTALPDDYVQKEFGMTATKISEKDGDLGGCRNRQEKDACLSDGAVTNPAVGYLGTQNGRYVDLAVDQL